MKELVKVNKQGVIVTTSRNVARQFGKRHDSVLRTIRELECSESFRLLNFVESSYKNSQNKTQPEFIMTKDGFTILVMGFTGDKAMDFKEKYIDQFNKMKEKLETLASTKLESRDLTDTIQETKENPMWYHYSNEFDMINRIVLGKSSKNIREEHGLKKGTSIRPHLTSEEIYYINRLQKINIGLYVLEHSSEKRKELLTNHLEKIKLKQKSLN